MQYKDERLRDMLAAEYVLGTLPGRPRARFERLLKHDGALPRNVAQWQAYLEPLSMTVAEVAPPPQVWRAIRAHIERRSGTPAPGFWSSLKLWRTLAVASSACLLVVCAYLVMAPAVQAPVSALAVLSDTKAQPAMVVSLRTRDRQADSIELKMLAPPATAADKSL